MQRRLLPNPVDVDHQVRCGDLVDVHHLVALENRVVDRLPGPGVKFLQHGSRGAGEIELDDDGAGQPDEAVPEAVFLSGRVLLHQPVLLERRQQPEHCRLVDLEPASQVGDSHLRLAAEQPQDLERPVERLDLVAHCKTGAHGTTNFSAVGRRLASGPAGRLGRAEPTKRAH